jgi:hypothetical protein
MLHCSVMEMGNIRSPATPPRALVKVAIDSSRHGLLARRGSVPSPALSNFGHRLPECPQTRGTMQRPDHLAGMGRIEHKWMLMPRNTTIVLGDKMYWSEPDQQFIILVKGHRFVKSIVRHAVNPPLARSLTQDDFSTFMLIDADRRTALEAEASAAYEAGFDRFGEWQMLFKSHAASALTRTSGLALSD